MDSTDKAVQPHSTTQTCKWSYCEDWLPVFSHITVCSHLNRDSLLVWLTAMTKPMCCFFFFFSLMSLKKLNKQTRVLQLTQSLLGLTTYRWPSRWCLIQAALNPQESTKPKLHRAEQLVSWSAAQILALLRGSDSPRSFTSLVKQQLESQRGRATQRTRSSALSTRKEN